MTMKLVRNISTIWMMIVLCVPPGHGGNGKSGTAAGRAELRKKLFADYDRVNIPDDVVVKFGLQVTNLDVNEEKGTLEVDALVRYMWKDSRLSWKNKEQEETQEIEVIRVDQAEIWTPDVTLYNSANLKDMMSCESIRPLLYNQGQIAWIRPCNIIAHCKFNLRTAPYGKQACGLKFASWTYDKSMMDLQLYGTEKDTIDISDYAGESWEILDTAAERIEADYTGFSSETWVHIMLNMTIQRVDPVRSELMANKQRV